MHTKCSFKAYQVQAKCSLKAAIAALLTLAPAVAGICMFYLCVLCICMHSRVFKMKCIKGMRKECTILCAFCVQYLHTTACQKCIQQVIRNANKMTTTGPRGSKAARIRNLHKSRKWAQSSILLPCKSDVHHWCLFPFFLVHLVGGTFQCF